MPVPAISPRLLAACVAAWPGFARAQELSAAVPNWSLGALAGLGASAWLWLLEYRKRRRESAALRIESTRFRKIVESTNAVVCEFDAASGRCTYASPQAELLLGYPVEAWLAPGFWEARIHGEDRAFALEFFASQAAQGLDHELEYRMWHADGYMVFVRDMRGVQNHPDGTPARISSLLIDLTAHKATELALEESEARCRSSFDQAAVGMALGTLDGRYLRANRHFTKITGYSEAELLQRKIGELTHPDDRAGSERLLASLLERGETATTLEKRILRRDGSSVWVRASLSLVRSMRREATELMEVIEDVSARRHAEAVLRDSESRLRTILGTLEEGIVMHAADGRMLDCNEAIPRIFGMSREAFLGLSFGAGVVEYVQADGTPRSPDTLPPRLALRTGSPQGGPVCFRRGDEIRTLWVRSEPLRHEGEDAPYAVVTTVADVTEARANEARIAFLAHHDPLTGLPNRTLLQDRLQHALARAHRDHSRVALLFLDLDRFKTINDSLGHPAGDRLLQAVTQRIRACVRESDTVCRQGGDEFIVVLQDIGEAEAPARVAEKIIKQFAEPFEVDGHSIGTSFSIGIAVYPNDGGDVDSLMKNADTAMYHAKQSGRNTYRFFTEAMNANALERLQLENQLRHALERGELMLHYQPQISLADGCVLGAEALIRWNNPLLGFVPPSRFIPIAEESGLILPIGAWVIREACRQARAWVAEGHPPITVAVNLSVLQFFRDDIVATVRNALNETGHPPELLELELTESFFVDRSDEAMNTIRQLKALGVRLSIDDFGIGYSCLSYLKRLAVDRLKIDQSFVRDVAHDADDAAIVRAVIQLGSSLKLDVIAEGAETAQQIEFLGREGCLMAQGYYYSPPVAPTAFSGLLGCSSLTPQGAPN